jgi:hypothetical protein
VHTGFGWGNPRERDRFEDPGIDGRIILKLCKIKVGWEAWTGFLWLRIGTSGELLWMR